MNIQLFPNSTVRDQRRSTREFVRKSESTVKRAINFRTATEPKSPPVD
jgi:hypothetical protein